MKRFPISLTLSEVRNLQRSVQNEILRIDSILDSYDKDCFDKLFSGLLTRQVELRNLLSTLYLLEDGDDN